MKHPESESNVYIQRDIDRVIALMMPFESTIESALALLRQIEDAVEESYELRRD